MSDHSGLRDLVRQIREASANMTATDAKNATRFDTIEQSVNEHYKRTGRRRRVDGER